MYSLIVLGDHIIAHSNDGADEEVGESWNPGKSWIYRKLGRDERSL